MSARPEGAQPPPVAGATAQAVAGAAAATAATAVAGVTGAAGNGGRRALLARLLRDPWLRLGVADLAGTSVGLAAWGLVTGVAMVKSGIPAGVALLMSLLVYAGSAQLAVIPLLASGAPLWVIWLTAACVNLRFVIFSSLWRCHFAHLPLRQRLAVGYFSADVVYVAFTRRFAQPLPQPEQLPWLMGAAGTNWLAWQLPSLAGILLAHAFPLSWGLGFAGVLALLGVLLSLLFDRATWLAAAVAAGAALSSYALPLKLNILLALAAAVAAGLLAEALERRWHGPPAPGGAQPQRAQTRIDAAEVAGAAAPADGAAGNTPAPDKGQLQ